MSKAFSAAIAPDGHDGHDVNKVTKRVTSSSAYRIPRISLTHRSTTEPVAPSKGPKKVERWWGKRSFQPFKESGASSTETKDSRKEGVKYLPFSAKKENWPWVWAMITNKCDWREQITQEAASEEEANKQIQDLCDMHSNQKMWKVLDDVYIGSVHGARDFEALQKEGITHVLNVGGSEAEKEIAKFVRPATVKEHYGKFGIVYKRVNGSDEIEYDMLGKHWEECNEFIQNSREVENSKLLIHCVAGRNRSGLILATDYMLRTGSTVLETMRHCRHCRGDVLLASNRSFQVRLAAMARKHDLLGPEPGTEGCIVNEEAAPWSQRKKFGVWY